MDETLQEVLQAVGVWPWLKKQFPDLSDDELLAAIQDDFLGLVADLLENGTAPRRQPTGADRG